MRKVFKVLRVLFFTLIIASAVNSFSVSASEKTKAIAAYKKYIVANKASYTYNNKFLLIYLNNDSIPELIYNGRTFTYKSGKVIDLQLKTSYYYKKKGVAVYFTAHANRSGSLWSYNYYKFQNNSFAYKLVKFRINSKGKVSYGYQNGKGKNLTKAQFNAQLKKMVGSTKWKEVRPYTNTVANRKKYLK